MSSAVSELDVFAARYPFGLDPFQLEACAAVEAGSGCVFCRVKRHQHQQVMLR